MAAALQQAYFPISELSTYTTKWTLRARVTSKGQLRTFQPKNGGAPGQVIDFHLLDESGSEIRANMFGPAAEQYNELLQLGKVYSFSRGSLRVANRNFNRCAHRYELVFGLDSEILEAADDAKIKTVSFEVTDLQSVQSRPLPCTVDLLGVIVQFRPVHSFTSSAGKELVKREITIADYTSCSMNVTLWGDRAKQEDKVFEGKPIVALKGVSVKEWQGGRTGSILEAGVMTFAPEIPEARKVQQWWAANGGAANFNSLSLAQDAQTDLQALQSMPVPCTVELCGVIVAFKPLFEFTSQQGKALQKREITVADHTGNSLTIAIWGERAKQDDKCFENNPVVSLKGLRIQEWNGGRSGSLLSQGMMSFAPSSPEAQKVQAWWSQGGSTQSLTALSIEGGGGSGRAATGKACTLMEMREAAEKVGPTPENFSVVCRLAIVQTKKQGEVQPLYYTACQEPKPGSSLPCNRRVDESGFCAACNRNGKVAPRLNLRCRFSDFTDGAWLTTFHEAAQRVLEKTAEEIQAMEAGEDGRDKVEAALKQCFFAKPMQIGVRAKQDSYNGELRCNISCVDARPVQRGAHGRMMLKEINDMLAQA